MRVKDLTNWCVFVVISCQLLWQNIVFYCWQNCFPFFASFCQSKNGKMRASVMFYSEGLVIEAFCHQAAFHTWENLIYLGSNQPGLVCICFMASLFWLQEMDSCAWYESISQPAMIWVRRAGCEHGFRVSLVRDQVFTRNIQRDKGMYYVCVCTRMWEKGDTGEIDISVLENIHTTHPTIKVTQDCVRCCSSCFHGKWFILVLFTLRRDDLISVNCVDSIQTDRQP